MQRTDILRHWDEAWNDGLWHAKWSQALEGLTPEQAASQPAPDRHSIWQLVNHMVFWRTYVIDRTRTGKRLTDDEIESRNWPEPSEVNEQTWADATRAYEQSHQDFRALIADEGVPLDAFEYMPYHDSYHIGQIMQIRAGLGLPPIE